MNQIKVKKSIVINVFNPQEKVGKTVTGLNIASGLSEQYNKKVLFVDSSKNNDFIKNIGFDYKIKFKGLANLKNGIDYHTNKNISIASKSTYYSFYNDNRYRILVNDEIFLNCLIEEVKNEFDYIIIDSSEPYLLSDYYLMPTLLDKTAFNKSIECVRVYSDLLPDDFKNKFLGLIPCMTLNTKSHKRQIEWIQNNRENFFFFREIRRTAKINEAFENNESIFEVKQKNNEKEDYEVLTKQIEHKIILRNSYKKHLELKKLKELKNEKSIS